MNRIIEKDTGRIRVVVGDMLVPGMKKGERIIVCSGGKSFKLSELGITWDFVDFDYSSNIIDLLKKEDPTYLEIIAKRFHPGGYFNEGDLVFFTKPGRYLKDYYGPNYPFIITEIFDDTVYNSSYDPETIEKSKYEINIGLKVYRGIIPTKEQIESEPKHDIIVSYSLLEFFPGDAFHILSRYDTEY